MFENLYRSGGGIQRSDDPHINITNMFRDIKPIFFNVSKDRVDKVRRKKIKNSRIVAEYKASQIPDNKGSTLSVDDLVMFINGINSCNITKKEFKSNHNNIKKDKKRGSPVYKKEINALMKNGNCKDFYTSDILQDEIDKPSQYISPYTSTNDIHSSKMNSNRHYDDEVQTSLQYLSSDEDNNFVKVVKRKSRHKKVYDESCNTMITKKRLYGNKNVIPIDGCAKVSKDALSNKIENLIVNDRESLNLFINKLWIEFHSCYEEYLKTQSHTSWKLEECVKENS